MDRLEKYITDHRNEFDDKDPSRELWHRINNRLDSSEVIYINWKTHLWKAASVILFAAVVWLLVDREYRTRQTPVGSIQTEQGYAFSEVENYYFQIINQKRQTIRNYLDNNPEVDEMLLADIDRLDSAYQKLKKSMTKISSEKILDAMVNNLQTRIEILNQQLDILERIKSIKDKENETSHS